MTPEAQLVIQANNDMLIRGRMNPYYKYKWEWEKEVREKNEYIKKHQKIKQKYPEL